MPSASAEASTIQIRSVCAIILPPPGNVAAGSFVLEPTLAVAG
jgi:hypothetical protein